MSMVTQIIDPVVTFWIKALSSWIQTGNRDAWWDTLHSVAFFLYPQFGHLLNPTHKLAFPYHTTATRVKADSCFLRETWSQHNACFWTSAHAVSQGFLTQWKESDICTLLHTRAHRCPWLVSVGVIDRRDWLCPSHPKTRVSFALLAVDGYCLVSQGFSSRFLDVSHENHSHTF